MTDEKLEIKIVPECGHSTAGFWGDKDNPNIGSVCWLFHQGGPSVMVPWPIELRCRHCGRVFARDVVRNGWMEPPHYSHSEGTFSCGCTGFDSSD